MASEDVDEHRMPFLEHLADLRRCFRNAAIAVLSCTVITYMFREYLFALMVRPFFEAWYSAKKTGGALGNAELVMLSPHEGFMVEFKVALLAGVFLAAPFIFRELWRFISPGLYAHEKRWGLAFVLVTALLFIGGGLFAYFFVLPAGFKYFLGYANDSMGHVRELMGRSVDVKLSEAFAIRPMISMQEYFGLTSMLLLVFGVVFELPMVLSVLAMLGIVTAGQLWRFNRYAIMIFAIAGAFLTPGDLVVGQVAMTGALTVLYNLSIAIAFLVGRRRQKESGEALAKSS